MDDKNLLDKKYKILNLNNDKFNKIPFVYEFPDFDSLIYHNNNNSSNNKFIIEKKNPD